MLGDPGGPRPTAPAWLPRTAARPARAQPERQPSLGEPARSVVAAGAAGARACPIRRWIDQATRGVRDRRATAILLVVLAARGAPRSPDPVRRRRAAAVRARRVADRAVLAGACATGVRIDMLRGSRRRAAAGREPAVGDPRSAPRSPATRCSPLGRVAASVARTARSPRVLAWTAWLARSRRLVVAGAGGLPPLTGGRAPGALELSLAPRCAGGSASGVARRAARCGAPSSARRGDRGRAVVGQAASRRARRWSSSAWRMRSCSPRTPRCAAARRGGRRWRGRVRRRRAARWSRRSRSRATTPASRWRSSGSASRLRDAGRRPRRARTTRRRRRGSACSSASTRGCSPAHARGGDRARRSAWPRARWSRRDRGCVATRRHCSWCTRRSSSQRAVRGRGDRSRAPHRRGWAPWLCAALAALAVWGARDAMRRAGDRAATTSAARRVAAVLDPGYAVLRDERTFVANASAWREARAAARRARRIAGLARATSARGSAISACRGRSTTTTCRCSSRARPAIGGLTQTIGLLLADRGRRRRDREPAAAPRQPRSIARAG